MDNQLKPYFRFLTIIQIMNSNPANMRAKNKITVKIEENPDFFFFNKNLLQPTFAFQTQGFTEQLYFHINC